MLRLFSLYDVAVGAYMRPFWADHKANALRSVAQLVNDVDNKDNMVAQHPEQFVLYELSSFNPQSGDFVVHQPAIPLGKCVEFKAVA